MVEPSLASARRARRSRGLALVCVVSLAACTSASSPAPPPTTARVSSAPTETSSAASPSPAAAARLPGVITGKLGYPSEAIPPLRVYAVDTSSPDRYRVIHTVVNQLAYTLAGVAPGTYLVFAHNYTISPKGNIGGYTRSLMCACPDHTLVPVRVADGQTTRGIDLLDWSGIDIYPSPPSGREPYAQGDRLTVTNPFADEINVRTEPGLGGRQVGTIPNGTAVEVLDGPKPADGYDWYFVRSATQSGWSVGFALRR